MSVFEEPSANGEKITIQNGSLSVPNNPIIPFIEGDGIGPDVWNASRRVLDAQKVAKAYGNEKKIHWMEVLAGEKANEITGSWLPEETLAACREYLVAIKGPLTTPIAVDTVSNVALRQILDLYVCLRPVRWFEGVPSPVRNPKQVDMVIFRENTEDIYAGIEFEQGSKECQSFLDLLNQNYPELYKKVRFPSTSGIGIKPVSQEGTSRLVRVKYQICN